MEALQVVFRFIGLFGLVGRFDLTICNVRVSFSGQRFSDIMDLFSTKSFFFLSLLYLAPLPPNPLTPLRVEIDLSISGSEVGRVCDERQRYHHPVACCHTMTSVAMLAMKSLR